MLSLSDWLEERRLNAIRIGKQKSGADRDGWLEDASYFARAHAAVNCLVAASGDEHANVPLRMHIALTILRAWNHGTAGYSADVVHIIRHWFDSGMKGPIPWPDSPFFAGWAESNGYARVGGYIGFKFMAKLAPDIEAANG